ncbi:hypothetical protein HUJ05_002604 [Dendroctonus ponderosae]|nr:hypothetical protein HUJ05_002604 [Dendroctonus ponderosae]
MECVKPTFQELNCCMGETKCIRNVCILAHVDHGKTTLCDLLLSTNCLVSQRMAGSLRYLDDRLDEQERGITMKSSAVSLLNVLRDERAKKYRSILLNLIDTPGHIDFSSEVGAAIRVCDGAIILVDAAEGVCVQTRESISKAYEEHVTMILVINKLDRLIMELHQDIDQMFQTIIQIIEDCNVIIAELYQYGFTNQIDIENTGLLFNPTTGNVIFGSAIDGWAFTTMHISNMMIANINGETVESLNEKMWNFDCWVDSKGVIKTGARDKMKQNIFIQLCLKTVVHVYESLSGKCQGDKLRAILEKLCITDPTRDMICSTDPKVQIRSILSSWNPLSRTVFEQCLNVIPAPNCMKKEKIDYLLNSNFYAEDTYLTKCVNKFSRFFNAEYFNAPTLCYVSKMFCVDNKYLAQNASTIFTTTFRRLSEDFHREMLNLSLSETSEQLESQPTVEEPVDLSTDDLISKISSENVVIALTRVFTGVLKVGQAIYVISTGYVPDERDIQVNSSKFVKKNRHVKKVVIKQLYMLYGRDLKAVSSVPAGNFCGIEGLGGSITRTATLSSELHVVPIIEHPTYLPVMKYAIEPVNPKDIPVLRFGLKLLAQSDSCVQVIVQENGEMIILTAGDVHFDKCKEDLVKRFAKIDIRVSRPIVSLRETITNTLIAVPKETIVASHTIKMSLVAVALPQNIAQLISINYDLIKMITERQSYGWIDLLRKYNEFADKEPLARLPKEQTFKSELTTRAVAHFKDLLYATFEQNGIVWDNLKNKIWCVSRTPDCANILINNSRDYVHNIFLETNVQDQRTFLAQCVLRAFQSCVKAGPICEEPLMNCAFIVNDFELARDIQPVAITPQLMSFEENAIKAALTAALENGDLRLMEPMYTTSIRVNTNVLACSEKSKLLTR